MNNKQRSRLCAFILLATVIWFGTATAIFGRGLPTTIMITFIGKL